MYWWNVSALAQELKAKTVSEREKFKYFLASYIVILIAMIPALKTTDVDLFKIIFYGIHAVIVIAGLYICYRTNCRGDNTNFIERFIIISWPISLRISFYMILIGLFTSLILPLFFSLYLNQLPLIQSNLPLIRNMIAEICNKFRYLFILIVRIFGILTYYWINKEIRYISGAK